MASQNPDSIPALIRAINDFHHVSPTIRCCATPQGPGSRAESEVKSRMPLSIALLFDLLSVVASLGYLIWRGQNLRPSAIASLSIVSSSSGPAVRLRSASRLSYKTSSNLICYDGPLSSTRPLKMVFIVGSRQREGAVGPGRR